MSRFGRKMNTFAMDLINESDAMSRWAVERNLRVLFHVSMMNSQCAEYELDKICHCDVSCAIWNIRHRAAISSQLQWIQSAYRVKTRATCHCHYMVRLGNACKNLPVRRGGKIRADEGGSSRLDAGVQSSLLPSCSRWTNAMSVILTVNRGGAVRDWLPTRQRTNPRSSYYLHAPLQILLVGKILLI